MLLLNIVSLINDQRTLQISIQEQLFVNDTVFMSLPLQHFGKITDAFSWCPLQPLPLLQMAILYILLQIVMGIIFSMHLFLVLYGLYPVALAEMWLQLELLCVFVELWGLASACPMQLQNITKKKVTGKIWMS